MSTITVEPTRTTTKKVTKSDIFTRAADLLEEFGWCQRAMVQNSMGLGLGHKVMAQSAESFCLWGAVARAAIELGAMPNDDAETYTTVTWDSLFRTPGIQPASWNDAPERTKEEVVQHLRQMGRINYATLP